MTFADGEMDQVSPWQPHNWENSAGRLLTLSNIQCSVAVTYHAWHVFCFPSVGPVPRKHPPH